MTSRLATWLAALWLCTGIASAQCRGADLMQTLPEAERDAIVTAAQAVPFPSGNAWQARRGDVTVTVVGTLHINDDRNLDLLHRTRPLIEGADLVILEATSDEMARLQDVIIADPGMAFIVDGPPLRDQLTPQEWAALRREMGARGVPSFMAGRMQPWLAFVTLSAPVCLIAQGEVAMIGLDALVEETARRAGVPVLGLEDHTILFDIFDHLSPSDSLDILRATLLIAPFAEDIFATLTNAYFDGEHRLVWEFSRRWLPPGIAEQVDVPAMQAIFARLEQVLLTKRNLTWMETLLPLTEVHSDIVLAVGAAHLSGHDGVLDLLDRAGFTLTRLTD